MAFIGHCGHDLAPRICRLRFDILFLGDRLQVRDLFLDAHRSGSLTITGLDSFKVFDPIVVAVYCTPRRGGRVFGDLHVQERDVKFRSEGALPVRWEPRDGVGNGDMGTSFVVHLEALSHQYKPLTGQKIGSFIQGEYPDQCLMIGV